MATDWIRQGDIVFVRVTERPKRLRCHGKKLTVAEGEVTGHHHVLEGAFSADNDTRPEWLALDAPVAVVHPEHATVEIPSGFWQIKRQREFWGEERRILD